MMTSLVTAAGRRCTGFTLVEVMVSVALISAVAGYFIHIQIQQMEERVVQSVAQDVLSLGNGAMAYFSQVGQWPDQDNECRNLVETLAAAGAFPVGEDGYQGPEGVNLNASCDDSDDIGRSLLLVIRFPDYAAEQARMLMSFLPTSSISDIDAGEQPEVIHYVPQPRRASYRYQFHKLTLAEAGSALLPKPDCPGRRNDPAYIVLPQAVCGPVSKDGLAGFYFAETDMGDTWRLQLRVAIGNATNAPHDFSTLPDNPDCEGEPITMGALTYCDGR
ncbi:MAG: hypothetical protein CML06_16750 [Pseudomonadales bacterium]|nr:hypothetical protein [Pseudomonadales bacterium]